jgi:hypothetical protein
MPCDAMRCQSQCDLVREAKEVSKSFSSWACLTNWCQLRPLEVCLSWDVLILDLGRLAHFAKQLSNMQSQIYVFFWIGPWEPLGANTCANLGTSTTHKFSNHSSRLESSELELRAS